MNSLNEKPDTSGDDDAQRDDRRILHPVRSRDDWPRTAPPGENIRRVCVVDCETTGLDTDKHQIIELCAAIVQVNDAGRVLAVQCVRTGLVDPGHPLPAEITELTGLTDADLAGHSICGDGVAEMLQYCESTIAFNSSFDRPFVDKLMGAHVPVSWACAMADVPWRALGYEPGPQGYLLLQSGYFMPKAHRAKDDVLALIQLLDHVCSDGETVMAKALAAMDGPAWRFEAKGAPYRCKDDLRDRRYRWTPERTHNIWHKHVRPASLQEELDWCATIGMEPVVVELPATGRYRDHRTWRPAPRP